MAENSINTCTGGEETQQEVVVNSSKGSGEGPRSLQGSRSSSGWRRCFNIRPHSEGAGNPDLLIWYRRSNKLLQKGKVKISKIQLKRQIFLFSLYILSILVFTTLILFMLTELLFVYNASILPVDTIAKTTTWQLLAGQFYKKTCWGKQSVPLWSSHCKA